MIKMLFVLLAGILFWGCQKKDDGTVTVVPLPPIDLTATVISTTQVNLSWTDKSTNEDGFKIQRKTGTGNFADVGTVGKDVTNYNENGLTPATTYSYRVYAYNNVGASLTYTNEVTVTTNANAVLPTLTTSAISNITQTTVTGGGIITNDGGSPITARGIVWSTSTNPTIALTTKTSDGTGTGSFTSNITGLSANTTYYVRTYATNSVGTAYGDERSFITLLPPASLTLNCAGTTNNGTLIEGVVASGVNSLIPYTGGNGGTYTAQTINSSGVTGLTATLTAGTLANGSGTLTFTITGTPATSGTVSFTFSIGGQSCTLNRTVSIATVTDASGNTYPTVTIGTQVWMAENLRTTKYRGGSNIPIVTDSTQWANNFNNSTTLPMMCWYNNDQATYTANKFGALYNWYAINPATNGNKNVCPTGWHVPTDAEWTTLTTSLGGLSVAGGKMKTTGTQYWISPNTGATNSSGWSGLPGGNRSGDGTFLSVGNYGYWWSSTGSNTANSRYLYSNSGDVIRDLSVRTGGFSVRCVRD